MAVAEVAGTVSVGALATTLTALWAYANGDNVGESVKKLWDNTKEKIEKLIPQDTSNESKIRVMENQLKTLESIAMKTPELEKEIANYKRQLEELKGSNNKEIQEEPPKNENPNKISPGGIIAGATAGIKENVNNIIKDDNMQNIESNVSGMFDNYMTKLEELQEKQWAREDSAYQRAVEDARLAGMNVGALGGNIQPAQSTTNVIASAGTTELNKIAEFLQQEIENNFKGDENEKDRFIQAIQMLFMYGLMSKK